MVRRILVLGIPRRCALEGIAAIEGIALDARLTRQMSAGMKKYVRELSARLPQAAPDLHFTQFWAGGNFGFAEQVVLPLWLRKRRPALTHLMTQYVPLWRPGPYVLTIHDLIHLRFPHYFKRKVQPYYRFVVRPAARAAACVISDDERTALDLQNLLGVEPERCRVVPLAADDLFFHETAPYDAPRPYFLYVGNHRPHKDLPTLLRAWQTLDVAADLYLTGAEDFPVAAARPDARVRFLGEVAPQELAGFYTGAVALVHPALAEGFGLPLVEAMAAGCPVLACADSVPSVLRAWVRTFPPRDVSALKEAMETLFGNEQLRRAMAAKAKSGASGFTWERCARATAAVYREVMEERGKR